MDDDAKRWDEIHKRLANEDYGHSIYAEKVEPQFPRNAVVVDLGGGTGADVVFFLRKGHNVFLLDVSEYALDEAKRRAKEAVVDKKLTVQKIDFGHDKLPLQSGSCDVIYSRVALNYFPKERTTGLFYEIYEALKKGGKAYVTLKSPRDTEEMRFLESTSVIFEPYVFIQNGQLRSRFPESVLREMLTDAGIPRFDVRAYDEDLTHKGVEHKGTLHLTEITFTKN